jgi:hypothetical protein
MSHLYRTVYIWIYPGICLAQTLVPAAAPTDWSFYGFILVTVALVTLVIWLHRKFPSQTAKVDAELKTKSVDVGHRIADGLEALVAKIDKAAVAPAPAADPAPSPEPVPAGKAGQAGKLSIDVTGDPATDLAAFQAAYFAKPAA